MFVSGHCRATIIRIVYAHMVPMKTAYRPQAPKKATNLSLNSELLAQARRLNINLSATMAMALAKEVSDRLQKEWLENNANAIEACNKLAEEKGLFSDSFREF